MVELSSSICGYGFNAVKKILLLFILLVFHKIVLAEDKYFIPIISDETYLNNYLRDLNIRDKIQGREIFKDIFDLHFNTWKEEFNREIKLNEKKYNISDKFELIENEKIKEEKINKSLTILREIIRANSNSLPAIEASFKLAIFSYFSKKLDAEKTLEILSNSLNIFLNQNLIKNYL